MAGIVDSRLLQCFPRLYREAKHLQWFLPMPMHYVSERDHAHVLDETTFTRFAPNSNTVSLFSLYGSTMHITVHCSHIPRHYSTISSVTHRKACISMHSTVKLAWEWGKVMNVVYVMIPVDIFFHLVSCLLGTKNKITQAYRPLQSEIVKIKGPVSCYKS